MLRPLLEDITKFASEPRFEEIAKRARQEYDSRVGGVHVDDLSYEIRMINFMEWLVFDYAWDDSGKTILDIYTEEKGNGSDGQLIAALKSQTRDIFQVKWSYDNLVKLDAIYSDKYIIVNDPERWETFKKKDVFTGRIVNMGDAWYLTNGVCVHPSKAARMLKKEMKKYRKTPDFDLKGYLFRLTAMSLKWERSRNIDVNDIYTPASV